MASSQQPVSIDMGEFKVFSAMITASVPQVMDAFYKTVNDEGGFLIGNRAGELASWSKKIPRTIRWRTTGKGLTTIRLIVTAGYKGVPIAKWYELGHSNKNVKWWHPAWPGHKPRKDWKWVLQAKGASHRPYLYPALQEKYKEVADLTLQSMVETLVRAVPYFSGTVSLPGKQTASVG